MVADVALQCLKRWSQVHGCPFLDGHGGVGGWRRFEGLTSLDDSSALRPIYFCATPPGRYLVSCTVASITVGVSCLVASIRAQWRSHLPCVGTLTEPYGPFRWCLVHAE